MWFSYTSEYIFGSRQIITLKASYDILRVTYTEVRPVFLAPNSTLLRPHRTFSVSFSIWQPFRYLQTAVMSLWAFSLLYEIATFFHMTLKIWMPFSHPVILWHLKGQKNEDAEVSGRQWDNGAGDGCTPFIPAEDGCCLLHVSSHAESRCSLQISWTLICSLHEGKS